MTYPPRLSDLRTWEKIAYLFALCVFIAVAVSAFLWLGIGIVGEIDRHCFHGC